MCGKKNVNPKGEHATDGKDIEEIEDGDLVDAGSRTHIKVQKGR